MRTVVLFILCGGVMALSLVIPIPTSSHAQEPAVQATQPAPAAAATPMTVSRVVQNDPFFQGYYPAVTGQHNTFQNWRSQDYAAEMQARKLAKEMADSDNDDKKAELKKQINDTLEKLFDEQQKRRQEEIKKIEEQVAKLKETLRKRADAKAEIIERRLEQLLHDAEGLGWSAPGGIPLGFDPIAPSGAVYSTRAAGVTTPAPAAKSKKASKTKSPR